MTDLVERLREQITSDHIRGCQGRCYSCDCGYDLATEGLLEQAATALEAQDKEIEALRAERFKLITDLADMKDRALKAEARAETAEQKVKELEGRRDERA